MMSDKDITLLRETGLPLLENEIICPQYHRIDNSNGICNLDDSNVFKYAGCNNPERCYKLKARGIKVERRNQNGKIKSL